MDIVFDIAISSYSSEKELLEIMELCIGHIGHALGRDSQRYMCERERESAEVNSLIDFT